jgi:ABC-2 type transport system permease protein
MTTATATRPSGVLSAGERGSPRRLAGTGTLIRFILRRDRIKLPAWLLGITLFLFYYATALPEVYQTDEQLQGLSTFMEGPAAALFTGPGYGREDLTIERAIVGVYSLYFFVLAALMSIQLVTRHTRADEQNGRTELVRANVVGRHAQLTAVLIVAVAANVLLSFLLAGGLAASGYDAGQGLLYGAGIGAVGLVFAGITALTVQVTEYSRAANGLAGAALGAAWAIRALGDMIQDHGSWLSWFSPMAWSQQTRAYVDGRWWPLALSVGLAVVAAGAGYVLSGRRDVGAGLVAARRGSPDAPAWLRSPFTFAFRLHRSSLIWWTVALGVAGFLFGAITDTIAEGYQDLGEDMLATLGGDVDRLVDGFLGLMAFYMLLMVCIFAIRGVHSLRAEETKGRAEPVLATATGRWAWVGSNLAVLAIGVAWLMLVAGFATGVGAAVAVGDAGYVWDVTWAYLVQIPAAWLVLTIAVLLFGVLPRAIGVTWAAFGYGVIVGTFGAIMDAEQWVYNLSPLDHIARLPLEELGWAPVLILTAAAAGLATLGLAAFGRRDLETK